MSFFSFNLALKGDCNSRSFIDLVFWGRAPEIPDSLLSGWLFMNILASRGVSAGFCFACLTFNPEEPGFDPPDLAKVGLKRGAPRGGPATPEGFTTETPRLTEISPAAGAGGITILK